MELKLLVHSTTRNAPYIHPSHDSILGLWWTPEWVAHLKMTRYKIRRKHCPSQNSVMRLNYNQQFHLGSSKCSNEAVVGFFYQSFDFALHDVPLHYSLRGGMVHFPFLKHQQCLTVVRVELPLIGKGSCFMTVAG